MEIRVTVFERRIGRMMLWYTVGLGDLDRVETGPTPSKVQQRLVDGLRKAIAKRMPRELERLELARGRKLEVVRVELALERGTVRLRFFGKIPLVIEPRPRGAAAEGTFDVVYHPMRPSEWFVHEEGRDLAEEATAYFRERWAALTEDELEPLKADLKDRMRMVAFSASPKTLLDELEAQDKKPPLAFLGGGGAQKGDQLLGTLGHNQSVRAIDGRLDPGMSRAPYREQLQQLVCGKQRAPVLLVGPSGVGKSMLLRQLVHDLLEADDYPSHRNFDRVHNVWQIRGHRIIAGMSYLGQWEQRCVDLLEASRKRNAILWVEDIQAWGRIGESRESDRSLATFFRGPLARGELCMLGECSAEGWQQLQDDAPGFASAFTTLFVEPTDRAQTMRMLVHEARKLELEHQVAFDPLAFRTIYELGGALGAGASYPGKALDLLRGLATGDHGHALDLSRAEKEAVRGNKINAIKIYRELTGLGLRQSKDAVEAFIDKSVWPPVERVVRVPRPPPRSLLDLGFVGGSERGDVGPREVVQLLARRTGMPELLLAAERPLDPNDIVAQFTRQIMGQDAAIAAVRDLILRIKAGLVDSGRPYGVFLFTGPTGTGKTEMAKCIAEYLYGNAGRLLRFDMSEYQGFDAPARLIGDRFRPEGALTSRVRAQPFCVVLLDEIEKASPAVLNLMLQLFDDGRLTDASGTVVDFSHAVVVMTSNLGAKSSPSLGFDEKQDETTRAVDAAVREFFPPELFNRIDRVVQFGPLAPEAARRIAQRELTMLLDRRGLTERNVFVRFTSAVVDLAVRQGFNPRDGARSLKRWLEDNVGSFLADEIAGAKAAAVRLLWLHMHEGKLRLHAEQLEEALAQPHGSALEDMLRWTGAELRDEIPVALERARALLDSPALADLAHTLSEAVRRHGGGEQAAAQDAFVLEQLRNEAREIADTLQLQSEYDPVLAARGDQWADHEGELAEARDFGKLRVAFAHRGSHFMVRMLDWRAISPALPLENRRDVLHALGSLHFLEKAIRLAPDAAEHEVLVELTRVSRSAGSTRFEAVRPGLLEWLASAYQPARGEVLGCAIVSEDGGVQHLRYLPEQRVAQHQIVLRMVGPAVRSFFAGEHGSHVRESLTGGTEVVRVRVLPRASIEPGEHVADLARQRNAFVAALEAGTPLQVEHPDAILPIVRRYDYDPQRADEPSWIEVEDYPLSFALRTQVRNLADVLPTLWLLRKGAV
jgi:ATP-dependent Clp protease ATP-binding subunit ClpC